MYESKDIVRVVKDIYGEGVSSNVIDRYIDNYLPRIEYHKVLLNGSDKIEISLVKDKTNIRIDIGSILYDFNHKVHAFISNSFIEADMEIKNNKLYIKGKRYSKYLMDKVTEYNSHMEDSVKIDIINFDAYLGKHNLAIKQKIIISARPEDFIKCSEDTTGWRSCFRIDGEYHCTTNAFYTDKRFLVSYIESASGMKIGRRWLHIDYDLSIVSSGKEYGTYDCATTKKVTEYIQSLINKDKWCSYINNTSVNVGGCYCDTEYTISYVKGNKPSNYSIYYYIEDGINYEGYVGKGKWYDDSCICDECGERCDEDDMIYIDGEDRRVCYHCADNHYTYCDIHDRYERNDDEGFYEYYSRNTLYRGCREGVLAEGIYIVDYDDNLILMDDAIWLADTGEYVHCDSGDYYYYEEDYECYSMDWYRDNIVTCIDTDKELHRNDCYYCDIDNEYYEDEENMPIKEEEDEKAN